MNQRFRVGALAWALAWALALACAGGIAPAAAQTDPRLTGGTVLTQLEAAQRDLAARAATLPDSSLSAAAGHLGTLVDGIRKAIGGESGKRLDKIDDESEGKVLRGQAAALLTQAWLSASTGCTDSDATTTAAALTTALARLAAAKASSNSAQAVIQSVETTDRRAVFAVNSDVKDATLVVNGLNLHDSKCDDPAVTATDEAGAPLAAQPVVTAVAPSRLELRLPPGLAAGPYVLHVVPKRKSRFLGCEKQPEASAVLNVVPPLSVAVSYMVQPVCLVTKNRKSVEQEQPAVSGSLPPLARSATVVTAQVPVPACEFPVSYAISAQATFGDGHVARVGPISQSASAGITTGIPGGVSLSWDPNIRQLLATLAAGNCKAIY